MRHSLAAGMTAMVLACGRLPTAPGDTKLLTISGHVYQQETPESGEPMVSDVLITVQQGDRSTHFATSDADGFYTVAVRPGAVSITASKLGYQTRASSFDMSANTILNFSLTPR